MSRCVDAFSSRQTLKVKLRKALMQGLNLALPPPLLGRVAPVSATRQGSTFLLNLLALGRLNHPALRCWVAAPHLTIRGQASLPDGHWAIEG